MRCRLPDSRIAVLVRRTRTLTEIRNDNLQVTVVYKAEKDSSYMKLRVKNNLIYLAILLVLTVTVLWLNQNHFFLCLDSSKFSNLLTPVIALFSVILLIRTLFDSQTFNSRQLAINEYNILLQDFELVKNNIEKLTFSFDTDGLSENFKKQLAESNGTNYISLFSQFLGFELTKTERDNEKLISKMRFGVIFPLIRNYRNLIIFLNEVIQNDILNDRYKKKFYLKTEQLLLQHYFRICNNVDINGEPEYDLKLFDSVAYKSHEFTELNKLFIEKNLFQINDLEFYKRTL